MNDSASSKSGGFSSPGSGGRKNPLGKRSVGGIAVIVLLAAYGFAQPRLNERYGWKLPGLKQDGRGQVLVDKSAKQQTAKTSSDRPTQSDQLVASSAKKSTSTPSGGATKHQSDSEKARGPLASRMSPTKSSTTPKQSDVTRGSPDDVDDGDLLYGLLRDTGNKRYVSPSGLMYTPGSAEGHRLEHLRRHTVDDTSRPIHGVFDGDMAGALKTIDFAYDRAKKNQKTTKQIEDDRTVYTVDMGKRIGFVGGQTGRRKRNPMARRVKLVLSGNRVITAFPL